MYRWIRQLVCALYDLEESESDGILLFYASFSLTGVILWLILYVHIIFSLYYTLNISGVVQLHEL